MSTYRPRVQTMKKQQTFIINEETFPSLSNLNIYTSKTPAKRAVMTEKGDDDCAFCNVVKIHNGVKTTINSTKQINLYKDKLKFSMDENKNNEKKSELPKGWIVLDRNYNPKKNKDKNNHCSSKEEQKEAREAKEEKIHFDFSPLIQLWKKRRENYIELYGEDNYIKMFGYGPNHNILYLDEDTNLSDSNDESLVEEEDDNMSSIE
jgi:hypothetical protein